MKRFILDSGIASDFINDRLGVSNKVREAGVNGQRVGIPAPVLGELLFGIENSKDAERNRKTIWHRIAGLTIWSFDKSAAEEYGRIAATLRKIGRPMQQIDIQIAAISFSLGSSVVVTKDSDLSAVPGLNVIDWSKL